MTRQNFAAAIIAASKKLNNSSNKEVPVCSIRFEDETNHVVGIIPIKEKFSLVFIKGNRPFYVELPNPIGEETLLFILDKKLSIPKTITFEEPFFEVISKEHSTFANGQIEVPFKNIHP